MTCSAAQIDDLFHEKEVVVERLNDLLCKCTREAVQTRDDDVRKHLSEGAGRRLTVLRRAVEKVFTVFPPSAQEPLTADDLADAEINLHAFVVNLRGVFDNWAWAYVFQHKLEELSAHPRDVGIFEKKTKKHLPQSIRQYIDSTLNTWHSEYLKKYRDALAHQVPLYIPPYVITKADQAAYRRLENEAANLEPDDIDGLEALDEQLQKIKQPCFCFCLSLREEPVRLLFLHHQMLVDAKTVLEFGDLFFEAWDRQAE